MEQRNRARRDGARAKVTASLTFSRAAAPDLPPWGQLTAGADARARAGMATTHAVLASAHAPGGACGRGGYA